MELPGAPEAIREDAGHLDDAPRARDADPLWMQHRRGQQHQRHAEESRQHVPGRGAVEESGAKPLFELHEPSPDRGWVQLQCSPRCGERPLSVQGEEIANIVPVEHGLHYRSDQPPLQLQICKTAARCARIAPEDRDENQQFGRL